MGALNGIGWRGLLLTQPLASEGRTRQVALKAPASSYSEAASRALCAALAVMHQAEQLDPVASEAACGYRLSSRRYEVRLVSGRARLKPPGPVVGGDALGTDGGILVRLF